MKILVYLCVSKFSVIVGLQVLIFWCITRNYRYKLNFYKKIYSKQDVHR
jgi:hypothetical protein